MILKTFLSLKGMKVQEGFFFIIFFTFITANESAVADDDPKFYRYRI